MLEWEQERRKLERSAKHENEIPESVITVKAQAPKK
jgi:hypothetical protein